MSHPVIAVSVVVHVFRDIGSRRGDDIDFRAVLSENMSFDFDRSILNVLRRAFSAYDL